MKQEIIYKIQSIIGNTSANEKLLISQLKEVLHEYELQELTFRESKKAHELVAENILELKSSKPTGNRINSGFTELDTTYGGLGLGEFIVIGGRPSMGKTQLLVNLALTISKEHSVLFFTFDLSEYFLTHRIISAISQVSINKLLQKDFTEVEKNKLEKVNDLLKNHQLYINDSCNHSFSAFKHQCIQMIKEHGVKVIFVDYLQMMSTNKHKHNRELEVSFITRELKNIAKEYKVCIIAASQLSRSLESRGGDKRPMLMDLRESGALEQDADKVFFIYRPDYYGIHYDENGESTLQLIELILAKNRNGDLGTIKLLRSVNFTHFANYEELKKDFSFSTKRIGEINS